MKNLHFTLLLTLFTFPALALETDNYIVWGKELKDSGTVINQYLHNEISKVLVEVNNISSSYSCREVTDKIFKVFESRMIHDNPVENWVIAELDSHEIFPTDLQYVEESIYRDPFRFYIPFFGLSPNIQVNGFYFGTDKLSHFASTGMIYFKEYLKSKSRGLSEPEALKKAIEWGIKDENRVHGYWASGVFSFADLEANYQGLLFYKRMCADYLKQDSRGNWLLQKSPDITDYVSGNWDESYLISYRLPSNWAKVKKVLKELYCSKLTAPDVRNRMRYYTSKSSLSFSMEYIRSLQRQGLKNVPDPHLQQSMELTCSTP